MSDLTITDARTEVKHALARDVLRSMGEARLPVEGASMFPAIRPGDVLEVERQRAADILPGEVVLFERDGRFLAHRVVEKLGWPASAGEQDRTVLVTRGDRLRQTDPPVGSEEVLGRITGVLRGNRRMVPRFTLGRRIASWVLGRSELATRVIMRLMGSKREQARNAQQSC